MVPLATFASSATRSTVVPCIPYRAITRRAASRISRTRNSLITSSLVMPKLDGQSYERTVSLGKSPKTRQGGPPQENGGRCRQERRSGLPPLEGRVFEPIAQNFGEPF